MFLCYFTDYITMVRDLKYCQDPFQKHKKRITTNLRKVTDSLAEKCDGKLKKDSMLCVNCVKIITKNPTVLSALENKSEQGSSESHASELSNISSNEDDREKDSPDRFTAENPSTSVDPVLSLLNQTPIKKSKYSYK